MRIDYRGYDYIIGSLNGRLHQQQTAEFTTRQTNTTTTVNKCTFTIITKLLVAIRIRISYKKL